MRKSLRYNAIFRPEPEGGFTVIVPSLPGCVTYGRDLKEAKKMVTDAIKGYITSLKKHKEPIPNDEGDFFTYVEVKRKTPVYV
jgi:predicted RNase H-like HicB family nuclease